MVPRKTEIGQIVIDRPFYGLDPFGDHPQWMSKVSGSLSIPQDGNYQFAGAADDKAALYLDGKPALFIPGYPGDVRFNVKLHLAKGRHDFVLYHVNLAADGAFSIGWKRPDMAKVEVMGRSAFGVVAHANPGPLEEHDKAFTADFDTEYSGECFAGGNFSHRYKLTARLPKMGSPKVEWDLGDGTTAAGESVGHVFVTAGVYPVRLTVRVGGNADTQTTRLRVDRDFEHLDKPTQDDPAEQAKVVAKYNVANVPARWLPWMTQMLQEAGYADAAVAAAGRTASEPVHVNPNASFTSLQHLSHDLEVNQKIDALVALWDRVPADSDLQPRAGRYEAQVLMWWAGDFDKAVKVIEPLAKGDDRSIRRAYAEALVLDGRAADGKKILDELQAQAEEKGGARLAAVSGAMARTIEARIGEGDWETGESEWEAWETRCPSVFTEGYSVLLRTRLMEIKKAGAAAAKVAEAFARSVPNSSYAPQLLDRAAKLVAKTDPKKSEALRAALRERYPEDPLSQDAPEK